MPKELCVTTDFCDDLLRAGRHFTRRDLDRMMAYAASLGAKRYQWVLDTIWTLYDDDSPVGYDLLAEACEAAHRHGMRFDVQFKPFEGSLESLIAVLPHTFPRPADASCVYQPTGLVHVARPFLVEHPEMRLAATGGFSCGALVRRSAQPLHPGSAGPRRPKVQARLARLPGADKDPGGRITALRLIKNDSSPAPFGPDDLSISGSPYNGGFKPYEGPVAFSESVEWRPGFPYHDGECRVITLGELDLPADTRFVVIRCNAKTESGRFANAIERLVEMVNDRAEVIPSTPSHGCPDTEAARKQYERASAIVRLGLSRYTRDPEVRERILDRDRFLEECHGMRRFPMAWEDVDLCEVGEVALARGKPRHACGQLSPVYPEVRKNWLEHVRFCIDRNVDGVNVRPASHNRPYEPWAYGYNEPVVEQSQHPGHAGEAGRINGEAYTQFLREAREMLHRNGKELGVHVLGLYFRHDDRAANSIPFPRNIDWQWETWIREVADYAEFQGANKLRPENIKEVTDRIGLAAREAGIPFIYRCAHGKPVHFDGPYPTLERDMDYARHHLDVTTYNLYETAGFSRINGKNEWEGSADMADLVERRWWRR